MSTTTEVDSLSFLERARSELTRTGADVTFDELVAGPLTEIVIKEMYGEETRGMSQRKLARAMGRPVQAVNSIVLGRKALTPRTALELERVLGIPAHVWTRLEADYRLALERLRMDRGAPVAPGS